VRELNPPATRLACPRPTPKSLKKKKEINVKAEFNHKTRNGIPKGSHSPHKTLLRAKEVYCPGSVLTSWLQDKFKGGSADKNESRTKIPKPITITIKRKRTVAEFQKSFEKTPLFGQLKIFFGPKPFFFWIFLPFFIIKYYTLFFPKVKIRINGVSPFSTLLHLPEPLSSFKRAKHSSNITSIKKMLFFFAIGKN
jgi:hypothetical protein